MRGLKAALLAVLALLMLLVLTLGTVLGTATGSRWALGFVPGLTLDNFHGRLGGQWSANHVSWQQGTSRVELSKVIFAWSPLCLTRMTLCIDQLQADQVSLQFPPGEEEQGSGPISLPDLKLPVALELGDIQVGSLLFNGSEQLKGLQLAAHWTEKGMQIDSVKVQRDDLSLNLSGHLQPGGNWPLSAEGQLILSTPAPWTLALMATC
jgi:translocation and assembly module TamB